VRASITKSRATELAKVGGGEGQHIRQLSCIRFAGQSGQKQEGTGLHEKAIVLTIVKLINYTIIGLAIKNY
jgi:hypothetical protein